MSLVRNEWCLRPQYYTIWLYGAGATWDTEMNFAMNHAPDTGLIIDLLTFSPACYHSVMVTPETQLEGEDCLRWFIISWI